MSHKLTWESEGVYWKYTGIVSGEEIIEATTGIYGDTRFDELRYKLVDFIDIESLDVTEQEVALLAFQHKSAATYKANIKNALVIRPELSELANKFVEFSNDSSWPIKVFDNMAEANKWLERNPPS